MKFCSQCAHSLVFEIPVGDNLPRYICPDCHAIFYQNPKIIVCAIPVWRRNREMAVLLCKRAIEPRSGLWTLPGGFMENGETTSEAAWRETQEEAGANVFVGELFSLMNLPTVRQVHLFYLAELQDLAFYPGPETEEVRLFTEKEVPWKEMAFTSTTQALKLFFRNQRKRRGANAVYPVDLPHLIYPNEARNDPV